MPQISANKDTVSILKLNGKSYILAHSNQSNPFVSSTMIQNFKSLLQNYDERVQKIKDKYEKKGVAFDPQSVPFSSFSSFQWTQEEIQHVRDFIDLVQKGIDKQILKEHSSTYSNVFNYVSGSFVSPYKNPHYHHFYGPFYFPQYAKYEHKDYSSTAPDLNRAGTAYLLDNTSSSRCDNVSSFIQPFYELIESRFKKESTPSQQEIIDCIQAKNISIKSSLLSKNWIAYTQQTIHSKDNSLKPTQTTIAEFIAQMVQDYIEQKNDFQGLQTKKIRKKWADPEFHASFCELLHPESSFNQVFGLSPYLKYADRSPLHAFFNLSNRGMQAYAARNSDKHISLSPQNKKFYVLPTLTSYRLQKKDEGSVTLDQIDTTWIEQMMKASQNIINLTQKYHLNSPLFSSIISPRASVPNEHNLPNALDKIKKEFEQQQAKTPHQPYILGALTSLSIFKKHQDIFIVDQQEALVSGATQNYAYAVFDNHRKCFVGKGNRKGDLSIQNATLYQNVSLAESAVLSDYGDWGKDRYTAVKVLVQVQSVAPSTRFGSSNSDELVDLIARSERELIDQALKEASVEQLMERLKEMDQQKKDNAEADHDSTEPSPELYQKILNPESGPKKRKL